PPAPPIGDDQPCPGGKVSEEPGEGRALPMNVDIGSPARQLEERGGTSAEHLIGERIVAVRSEACLRQVHARILPLMRGTRNPSQHAPTWAVRSPYHFRPPGLSYPINRWAEM